MQFMKNNPHQNIKTPFIVEGQATHAVASAEYQVISQPTLGLDEKKTLCSLQLVPFLSLKHRHSY